MKEANIRDGTPALIADINIRGLWESQAVALLDVRVVDTDAMHHRTYIGTQLQYFPQQKKRRNGITTVQLKHVEHLLPILLYQDPR